MTKKYPTLNFLPKCSLARRLLEPAQRAIAKSKLRKARREMTNSFPNTNTYFKSANRKYLRTIARIRKGPRGKRCGESEGGVVME